ncbi:MAG: tetratricopeptide repeat protein [Myxococcales bacterium]|nr:tetratricopeptide repeat protein [Myxococcales bacterium]
MRGALTARVAPLASGHSFEVSTAHLSVRVVGTRFTVLSDARCSSVAVREGTVFVETEGAVVPLTEGQDLQVCGEQDEPSVEAPHSGEEPIPSETELMRLALDAVARGELEQAAKLFQNVKALYPGGDFTEDALFHQAVIELQRGHVAAAESAYEELKRRFPESRRLETLEPRLRK